MLIQSPKEGEAVRFDSFGDLGRIDIVIDNIAGHDALYYFPEGSRFGMGPSRPRLVGSMQAFGAWMAFHLAAAYRPEVPSC